MTTIHMRMPRSARKLSAIGEKRAMALERFDDSFGWALTLLILAAPLCYGAVEDWAVFTLELMLAAFALLWLGRNCVTSDEWGLKRPILLPAASLLALAGVQALWSSTYKYASKQQFLFLVSLLCATWLVGSIFEDRVRAKRLVWSLVIFGGLLSLFAIVQYLSGTQKLYWIRQPRNFSVIFGPYVNHAHYAGLMEMLVPFPLVMALSHRYDTGLRVLLAFAAACMGISIILSGSRGGLIAFAVQLLVVGIFVAHSSLRISRLRFWALSVGAIAMLGLLFAWLGNAELRASFAALKDPTAHMVGGFRLQVLRDSLPMFVDKPFLGWGLGTFEYAFPRYQRFYSDYTVNFAHNDYLQLAVEAGMAGLAILGLFFYRFFQACRKGLGRWEHESLPAAKLAALIGCIGIFVHSLTDFNMHVPANALMFVTIASLATLDIRTQKVVHRAP